ncbi:MAG: DsrE family protein [Gammaproteobacteria bacterium]|nr:DsrE family protein [Gammaproteobacteria bacterium]MCW8840731.1 DsrE family protein [Gammaproteobacteria bacterium]MCW8927618.1 DsrE family protein [Gammaproteobacteria bacterium]MCW8958350.1 DsrE family protein [Gammaproteobacteria bacterium]MCW8972610.1 DsrE family protein [Gammaproteobacteria bacterium]
MAEKLLIIMMNTDPAHPVAVATPLFQATIAASMEFEVEVVFTGRCGELAASGLAKRYSLHEGGSQSVYDLIREAHEAGVTFKVCSSALEQEQADTIPEIAETVGSAYIIAQVMSDDVVSLTY